MQMQQYLTTKHRERNVLVTVPFIVITSEESDVKLNASEVDYKSLLQ